MIRPQKTILGAVSLTRCPQQKHHKHVAGYFRFWGTACSAWPRIGGRGHQETACGFLQTPAVRFSPSSPGLCVHYIFVMDLSREYNYMPIPVSLRENIHIRTESTNPPCFSFFLAPLFVSLALSHLEAPRFYCLLCTLFQVM